MPELEPGIHAPQQTSQCEQTMGGLGEPGHEME
jgi:hypothetical protein